MASTPQPTCSKKIEWDDTVARRAGAPRPEIFLVLWVYGYRREAAFRPRNSVGAPTEPSGKGCHSCASNGNQRTKVTRDFISVMFSSLEDRLIEFTWRSAGTPNPACVEMDKSRSLVLGPMAGAGPLRLGLEPRGMEQMKSSLK